MKKIGKTIRRRRKQFLTDYKARLGMLKSGMPRLVIRKTNRYIIAQIIESDVAQDKIIVGVTSRDLLSVGWPKELSGSLKGKSAAYLTGLLLARKTKIKTAILDMGLQKNSHKGRIYAAVKGVIDGGLDVPCGEEALPEEDLKSGDKVGKIFEKVKGEILK